MGATSPVTLDPRVRRTRAAVLDAATTLFLRSGYPATSMDDIAAAAGVAKRTLYNNFADKEALFRDVVMGATSVAERFATDVAEELADPPDVEAALTAAARRLVSDVTSTRVVRLRRLLIGEAHRFPDLAAEYYDLAPGRVMAAVAAGLERLAAAGRLRVDDPARAAEQFAFLVLGAPLDRALFRGDAADREELARIADDGVRTFLARYGRDPS